MTAILVTGGAGYVGSHAVRALLDAGARVVVLDDLSLGHREAVDPRATFVMGDVRDEAALADLLRLEQVDAVLHLAAASLVGESVREPERYRSVNVDGTRALLAAMATAGVERLVFASSAAVHGAPERLPLDEGAPTRPVNPYGETKLAAEALISGHAAARPGFGAAILRLFNVIGAHPDGDLGEDHHPETHLVPLVVDAALGRRTHVTLHGTDHPTPDGSCQRDYVHVCDVVDAQLAALAAVVPGRVRTWNVGRGVPVSVRELVAAVEAAAGRPVAVVEGPRRDGDPPRLWADPAKIRTELGWAPRHLDLVETVGDVLRWRAARARRSY